MENKKNNIETWHDKHVAQSNFGQKTADKTAAFIGSWVFIFGQTILVILWMSINSIAFLNHWDPFPFILLNLLFSTQAAYAAPILMMAQNRQNERDRYQAKEDYFTNVEAKKEIEELQKALARIENEKLEKIMDLLKNLQNSK